MNFRSWFAVIFVLLLVALIPCAAQRGGHAGGVRRASPGFKSGFESPIGNFAVGGARSARGLRGNSPYGTRNNSPYGSLPFSFFGDSFNPDDIYSSGYPVASEPPAFLLQAARSLSGQTGFGGGGDHEAAAASSQPLMIELQNGRYVRVNPSAVDGEARELAAPSEAQISKAGSTSVVHDIPSAVLVFRDGHSEEVRDYTIADGALYARGDFYRDGYWNKKIELSSLDVAETARANAARNVKFVLPSSSNEVIARF